MEKNLIRYIWTHTRKQQLWILVIAAVSMIPYFLALDLPKQIVNGPIQGIGFESAGATQKYMAISIDIPLIGTVPISSGIDLDRMSTLWALSFTFLLLVIANGLFKYYINTFKGRLGERLLRRIRFELIDRILRFPPARFKRVKGAEIASMVKDEVEPLGGFTGDAFVQPALLCGQAIAALFFIFLQNFWLGLIAAFMAGLQVGIIPQMRKRLIELGRQRQLSARRLAGRVSEIVDGISTIHAYDTSNYERADAANRLGHIFRIRYDLYQWKFMVKFINNFLAQLTPFLFYSIGGYLTLQGSLDVGQLVAVINAYKELPGPLKDLIDWDQARQDVQVKYEQVIEQFGSVEILDSSIQAMSADVSPPIGQALCAVNLTLEDESGVRLLEHATLHIEPGETVAIVGGAGAEALADAMGRVSWPAAGRVAIGDRDILEIPESVTGRRISFVSSDSHFFQASLKDNLLYGLKHAPMRQKEYSGAAARQRKWEIDEAKNAGNPDMDFNSDWIDYSSSHVTGADPEKLDAAILEVLGIVHLENDILEFAMRSSIDPLQDLNLAARIVEMRHALREELKTRNLSGLVAPFEPDRYNNEASVGENLLFGTMRNEDEAVNAIVSSEYFRSVMIGSGLSHLLFDTGFSMAENLVEIFADLPADHPFFQELPFLSDGDIPMYQHIIQRLGTGRYDAATKVERRALIRLSFFYVEPRHRFGLLTPELQEAVVAARHRFHADLPSGLRLLIERYDPERYLSSASLIDNILFGRLSYRHADASRRVRQIAADLMRERGLYQRVLAIGLEFDLGAGGKRLTTVQRQKLNLARALVRQSDFYIFNRPLPGLDPRLQEEIVEQTKSFLRRNGNNPAIIWVLSNMGLSSHFGRVIVIEQGALAADGSYETLYEENSIFRDLVAT